MRVGGVSLLWPAAPSCPAPMALGWGSLERQAKLGAIIHSSYRELGEGVLPEGGSGTHTGCFYSLPFFILISCLLPQVWLELEQETDLKPAQ